MQFSKSHKSAILPAFPVTLAEARLFEKSNNLTNLCNPEILHFCKILKRNGNATTIEETIDAISFTTTQTFDNLDRMVSKTDVFGNSFNFEYDNNGNRKVFKDHNSALTNYIYDGLNRLKSLTHSGLGTFDWSYNSAGLTNKIDYPNDASVEYNYDNANRIESILNKRSGANITSHLYEYDPNGNRTRLTESNIHTDQEINYTYDQADRLTSVIYPTQTTTYGLDKVGNRDTETITGANPNTKTYSYNNRDQLTGISDTNGSTIIYGYDDAGNQLTKDDNGTITTFDYTARHRVKSITVGAGSPINYQYDYTGQRVNYESNGMTKHYLYDGLTLIAQTNTIGNTIARYHYGDRYQLAETRNNINSYYHVDSMGTNVAVTNQGGSIQARYEYDAYGNVLSQENPGLVTKTFGFTGYQEDDDTGLYYANARYYDSNTGRFLREDPQDGNTSQPPSLHRYLYANANPNFYTDPTGEAAYAFDGTGQDMETGVETNVARLLNLIDSPNRFYQPGVGTNQASFIGNGLGAVAGYGGDERLDKMYQNLIRAYNGVGKDGSQITADRDIDLIGFSRGAGLARAFANMINEKGIPDLSSARVVTVSLMGHSKQYTVYDNYFKPEIRSMTLFDTVGSFGLAGNQDEGNKDLSIPDNVQAVRHAISRDEKRDLFPLTSAIDPSNPNDPRIIEKVFEGSHTDVGCCYLDDDSLSQDPLFWTWNELKKLNVPIDSLPPKYMPIPPHEATPQKFRYAGYIEGWVGMPQQGGRTKHGSQYFLPNQSPRKVFYLRNGVNGTEQDFNPVTYPEHERFLRELYGKDYQFITEDEDKP